MSGASADQTSGFDPFENAPAADADIDDTARMTDALTLCGVLASGNVEHRIDEIWENCGLDSTEHDEAYIRGWCKEHGVEHAAFAAASMMCALFAVSGVKTFIRVSKNYKLKCNMFTIAFGEPASGKTILMVQCKAAMQDLNETNEVLFANELFLERMAAPTGLAIREALRTEAQKQSCLQMIKQKIATERQKAELVCVGGKLPKSEEELFEAIERLQAFQDATVENAEADGPVADGEAVDQVDPAKLTRARKFISDIQKSLAKTLQAAGSVDFSNRSITMGTWEKILARLVMTPCALMACDEANRLLGSFNQYKDAAGVDEAILCELFTAMAMGTDTISRGRQIIEYPQFSIFATGVPSQVESWLNSQVKTGPTGMQERFEWVYMPAPQSKSVYEESVEKSDFVSEQRAALDATLSSMLEEAAGRKNDFCVDGSPYFSQGSGLTPLGSQRTPASQRTRTTVGRASTSTSPVSLRFSN